MRTLRSSIFILARPRRSLPSHSFPRVSVRFRARGTLPSLDSLPDLYLQRKKGEKQNSHDTRGTQERRDAWCHLSSLYSSRHRPTLTFTLLLLPCRLPLDSLLDFLPARGFLGARESSRRDAKCLSSQASPPPPSSPPLPLGPLLANVIQSHTDRFSTIFARVCL